MKYNFNCNYIYKKQRMSLRTLANNLKIRYRASRYSSTWTRLTSYSPSCFEDLPLRPIIILTSFATCFRE